MDSSASAVEIAFIQKLVLFLGHPLYAAALTLAAFLGFAGLGAGASPRLARLAEGRGVSPIAVAVVAIGAVSVLYLVALPPLFGRLIAAPTALKVAAALAVIAPLAFAMGMPFPLGLARLSASAPRLVPWAWDINGCASVASPPLATLLALHFGFAAVVGLAVALYATAWATFAASRRGPG